MNIQRLPLSQLQPAPYNPRVQLAPGDPGWEKLRRSLDEFDLVQPVVWNRRTGHVVSGHQRLEVLRQSGREEVDCAIVDLSLEREKALNVTLNNSSVGGDWVPDQLIQLVKELDELPDFDATLTGFDERELKDLVFAPQPECLPPEPADDSPSLVRVTLEIPPEFWGDARDRLDRLLTEIAGIRLHAQLPPSA